MFVPRGLMVKIAGRCNLSCIMCERHIRAERDMTRSVWGLVKERLIPHVREVELTGLGEPTMHPNFDSWAKDVVASGKRLIFPTNGHFLDRTGVIGSVGDNPTVSISIDAASKETYEKIRVGGDFERVKKNIVAFHQAVPGAEFWSTFVAMSENIDELPDFIDLAASLGISRVVMKPVDCWTIPRYQQSLRFQKERAQLSIARAMERAKAAGVDFTPLPIEFHPTQFPKGVNCSGFACSDDVVRTMAGCYINYYCPYDNDIWVFCFYAGSYQGIRVCNALYEWFPIEPWNELGNAGCYGNPPGTRSVNEMEPVVEVPVNLVVDASGDLETCVARHSVGNVHVDTWDSLLANPIYQRFLENKFKGRADDVCSGCDRKG